MINMKEEETEAKTEFYNSLAKLLDLICEKIENQEPWIHIYIEKKNSDD
jgi:hypothetical protein